MLEKNFTIKADANDYSPAFAEGHKEVNGFTEWDVKVKVEEQTEKTIVADISARGTGTIVTVSACRIFAPMGVIPVAFSVPDFKISGYTSATKQDTIYQVADLMAKINNDDEVDSYRVDAISVGTVIAYLEEELKNSLK